MPKREVATSSKRRPRPPAPATFDTAKKWPRASFDNVEDEALRDACLAAQDVARALLRGAGERGWSDRRLATEADVAIDQARGALNGTSWVLPYTTARLLHAVRAYTSVVEEEQPRR